MELSIKQISSLEKVNRYKECNFDEVNYIKAVAGERVSYQVNVKAERTAFATFSVKSPIKDAVKLFSVKDVFVEVPFTEAKVRETPEDDYLIREPAPLPDVLRPLSEQKNAVTVGPRNTAIWVRIDVPKDLKAGKYEIEIGGGISYFYNSPEISETFSTTLTLEVIDASLDEHRLIYTRWFYADCISNYYNLPIYSERHWELIEKFIAAAADVGVNMILVPVHTPPLDTEIGSTRPSVQLVDVEKKGDKYIFGFEKLERFVEIAKRAGMKYFEIAHMFSQWGAKYAANIEVTVDGKKDYMFGWGVEANDQCYIDFLKQYVPAIQDKMEELGVAEYTYYHISDEPNLENKDGYKTASEIFKKNLGKSKTFDALSHVEFYDEGLVDCPVTSISHIHEFLEKKIENQWLYYCGGPQTVYTNSLMAFPSYRVRIIGFQMYKYDIKGFLHWGLNFYNAALSKFTIDPYLDTSPDGTYPSGDGYIVYPAPNSVYGSIRGEVMYQALDDIRICQLLEKYVGREKVVEMIDKAAGMDLRFDVYPKGKDYIEKLRAEMIEEIEKHI